MVTRFSNISKIVIAIAVVLALALCCVLSLSNKHGASAWADQYASNVSEVSGFTATQDDQHIYLTVSGNAWYLSTPLTLSGPDGVKQFTLIASQDGAQLLESGWIAHDGVIAVCDFSGASVDGQSPSYVARYTVPKSLIPSGGSLSLCGSDVAIAPSVVQAPVTDQEKLDAPNSSDESVVEDKADHEESGSGDLQGGANDNNSAETEVTPDSSAPPTSASPLTPNCQGQITVDGALLDWAAVPSRASSDSEISEWKIARGQNGAVYLCFTGTAPTEWYGNYYWKNVVISQDGITASPQIYGIQSIPGASVSVVNDAHWNTAASYYVELMLPAEYFTDSDALISFAGSQVSLSAIPVIDGNPVGSQPDPIYSGITIDGNFADWDAVGKHDIGCPNPDHPNCLDQMAVVFDGDVYIYINESPGLGAYHAGTHENGKFEILTDLDRNLVFQLNQDGSISGIDGAKASHVGSQWEILIPSSALPPYKQSISVGLYQAVPFVSGVSDLQGSIGSDDFSGVVCDGQYDDWTSYPHHLIQYATAGTQVEVPDGEGALYAQDSKLYAHIVTEYIRHVEARGYDLGYALSIAFNGDRNYKPTPGQGNFYPYIVAVDANGNINYNPDLANLENGTHELYVMDSRSWHSSQNIYDLHGGDDIFGRVLMTIGDNKCEAEFEFDLQKIASYIGTDANDFRIIDMQFGRIGQEWITTAGTSTGPFVGIAICILVVAICLVRNRVKKKSEEAAC